MSAKDTSEHRCDWERDVLAFVSIAGLDVVAGGVAKLLLAVLKNLSARGVVAAIAAIAATRGITTTAPCPVNRRGAC
jgi:hypothetical protein